MSKLRRSRPLLLAGLVLATSAVVGVILVVSPDRASPGHTWEEYRVTPDGLTVYVLVRQCDEPSHAVVEEQTTRIEVTLHVDSGGVCSDLAVEKSIQVELSAPLVDRPVFDGACLASGKPGEDCRREKRNADRSRRR